ncbi:hypothetical protein SAMN04488540_10996 [Ferrimonas sediminum]|uniref:Uncharacterized protein n=1 Tax=Ferrimonas sediminum TaxID=718193 RepID=A0A1G8UI05_9GAMM|nr:hypothetical protein [Ferrimonas sediminum]SDJ53391.1 hypothetical protein SAMN04488540_10996 [Ferrimonas sediminum]
MSTKAQQLLIKLGLDAELSQRFSVDPNQVYQEFELEAEGLRQIEQLIASGNDDSSMNGLLHFVHF